MTINKKWAYFLVFSFFCVIVLFLMYKNREHRVEEFQEAELEHFELNIAQEYEASQKLMKLLLPFVSKRDNNQTFESLISFQSQLDRMKESPTNQIFFIIGKKTVKKEKSKENYIELVNLNDFLISDLVVHKNKKIWDVFNQLSLKDAEIINQNLAKNKSFNIAIVHNFQYRLLQFVPQKLFGNDKINGYYVYYDNAEYLDEMNKDFKIVVLGVYLILVVIFYFLYYQSKTKDVLNKKNRELEESWKIVDKYVIFSITDTDGIITEVSSAFCDISGFSKEEIIGNTHRIVRHPDTTNEYFEQLWSALIADKIWIGFVKNRKKNGDKYWIKTFIEPLFDKNGIKIGYKNIAIDISDSKALEKANKTLKKKIKRAVKLNIRQYKKRQEEQLQNIKLSSIGALSAGITHEINTPLTYIKGNFEMMKYDIMDLENNDSLKENLLSNHKRITDGILRISNIIEAMREIASSSKEDIKVETNVYRSLITALTMVHNKSKQISKIYLDGSLFDISMCDSIGSDSTIFVNKQRIEQVWIVIINNALDELVKIEEYEERRLSITIEESKDKIMIYFKDNAGGIDEKILGNLFDPFVSTKESGGMGIGLNIAKKIIDSNDGKIEAYNKNNGAVFKITFQKSS